MAEIERYQKDSFSSSKAVRWISIGLMAWVVLLAMSSFFTDQGSWLRSAIMIAPAIIFVAFWIVLVRLREVEAPADTQTNTSENP